MKNTKNWGKRCYIVVDFTSALCLYEMKSDYSMELRRSFICPQSSATCGVYANVVVWPFVYEQR